ncbi:MAG TPA: FAD-dependent oxidoreductase [Petrimonas sp.]|jgi:NADPH-dependent 2,4-dienoyl-CoA reductase/sulfur reductase-like enzyme/rhodanese-related sulfurtransferase|nr:FAD-dependent oxidoreductase [Petrimonas sp.]
MKIVIIGGVAGGATAAARLRRLDEKAEIILFERDAYVSFANCGLPYHIGGVIEHREKLLLQTPEGFKCRYNIDVRVLSEVIAIHPDSKSVTVREVNTGRSYVEGYDKLIVSTGASPLKPNIKGVDNERVFTLRNMSDMDRIKAAVACEGVGSAVVVGAGFIGLEMAENLKKAGLSVTVIEQLNQVMNTVDYPMASMVHRYLRSLGVNLLLGETVTAVEPEGDRLRVRTESQKAIDTDMVILSIGVRPETGLVREAGLMIGCLGGIKVNEYMQTSHPDIYAVGDAVEVTNLVTGKPALIPLAGPANKQARIAADNIIMGNSRTYKGTVGTCIAKLFDMSVAAAGATERQLQNEGIEYITSICHGSTHSGYYPGALPISLKINFAPDGKLLGAQAVGFGGVDKRIDLLAQVIRNGGTVQDLQEIEQAYAPPFSSAKDPVNMAGFIAENIVQGRVKIIHWHDIDTRDPETVVIDVRTNEEYQAGHIEQSLHIPVDELRERLSEVPKGKTLYIYCKIGLRGYVATRILMQHGFEAIYNLSGGYDTYSCVKENISR